MKQKKILAALTAAVMSLSVCLSPASAAQFYDTQDHPAAEAINTFSDLKILEGDGTGYFYPYLPITRGDFCVILDRILTYQEASPNSFPDLPENTWYTLPVLKLNAAGVVYGDGTGIRPLDSIRWDEALTMIARALSLTEAADIPLPVAVSDWARGWVGVLWTLGCLPVYFDPAAPFTRGDMAAILDAAIQKLGWSAVGKIRYRNNLVSIRWDVPPYNLQTDQFYRLNNRLYYNDGITRPVYGIDVSAHQGEIDWQAVAGDGIEFAIIRLGYRGYGSQGSLNVDKYFEQNYYGALNAGIPVGLYFFSQALTPEEAVEEANFLLETLAGRPLTYPIVFDWEYVSGVNARTDGLSGQTITACAQAFCQTIAAAGYQPMAYFNMHLGYLRYDLSALKDYPFWFAYYTDENDPKFYYNFRMWQYSSTGSVAGIEGNVDMDICFVPYGAG